MRVQVLHSSPRQDRPWGSALRVAVLVGCHTACTDDHRADPRPGGASAAVELKSVDAVELKSVDAPVGAGSSFGLAAHEDQTCAWSGAEDLACWGGSLAMWREPVPEEARPIHELIISNRRRCARSDAGRVTCWEYGSIAEAPAHDGFVDLAISDDTLEDLLCGARGHEVVCWTWDLMDSWRVSVDAVAVSQANRGVCALGSDGRVRCWQGACRIPVVVPGLDDAVAIAGPCAARRDGSALCWPAAWCTSPDARPTPRGVPRSSQFTALVASRHQACARALDGRVACWGIMPYGRRPSRPLWYVDGPVPAPALAVGDAHACAGGPNATIVCWGDNRWHQLGEPHNVPYVAVPAPIVADAKELGVSWGGGCVIRADDRVWCWGFHEEQAWVGEQAWGGEQDWDGEARPLPDVAGTHGLVMRGGNACVRRRGAPPVCWSSNKRPVAMPWLDRPRRPIARLRLAKAFGVGCAVHDDATAECVDYYEGRMHRKVLRGVRDVAFCGDALCIVGPAGAVRCTDWTLKKRLPFPITRIEPGAELRCSEPLACVAQTGGAIRCWAHDHRPPHYARVDHLLVDGALRGSERAAALSWMGRNLCLLDEGGGVECSDVTGALVPVPGARHAVEVAVGDQHACLRQADGAVACWGRNLNAAAGVGSSARQDRPVVVLPFGAAPLAREGSTRRDASPR